MTYTSDAATRMPSMHAWSCCIYNPCRLQDRRINWVCSRSCHRPKPASSTSQHQFQRNSQFIAGLTQFTKPEKEKKEEEEFKEQEHWRSRSAKKRCYTCDSVDHLRVDTNVLKYKGLLRMVTNGDGSRLLRVDLPEDPKSPAPCCNVTDPIQNGPRTTGGPFEQVNFEIIFFWIEIDTYYISSKWRNFRLLKF